MMRPIGKVRTPDVSQGKDVDKEFQLILHLSGDTDVAQEELSAVFALMRTHLSQGCLYDHTSRPERRLGPRRERATPVSQLSNWYQSEFPQIGSSEGGVKGDMSVMHHWLNDHKLLIRKRLFGFAGVVSVSVLAE